MTIFEPAAHELDQPDAEPIGMEECRFYVTEVTEVNGRQVVTGIDLDTFQFRSFFTDEMENVTEIPRP